MINAQQYLENEEGSDTDAAISEAFASHSRKPIAEARRRGKAEKKMARNPHDKRHLRSTGRTRQFNCKIKPNLHDELAAVTYAAGLSITEWLEKAAQEFVAAHARGGQT